MFSQYCNFQQRGHLLIRISPRNQSMISTPKIDTSCFHIISLESPPFTHIYHQSFHLSQRWAKCQESSIGTPHIFSYSLWYHPSSVRCKMIWYRLWFGIITDNFPYTPASITWNRGYFLGLGNSSLVRHSYDRIELPFYSANNCWMPSLNQHGDAKRY